MDLIWKILLSLVFAFAVTGTVTLIITFPRNLRYNMKKIKPYKHNVRLIKTDKENGSFFLAKINDDGSYCKDFKILGFTDLHIAGIRRKDRITIDRICENIEREKPDMVVLLGDLALVWFNKKRTRDIAKILDAYGIYWTVVLGNHEGEDKLCVSREETMKIYSSFKHCLANVSIKGVEGYGNQIINILTDDNKISQSLFFMFSGGENTYNHIKPSQVDWYEKNITALQKDYGNVKSMIFMHMPIRAYLDAYEAYEKGESKMLWGVKWERICCSKHDDSGLYEMAKKLKSTETFVCGHDHVNNFGILHNGILFMYNQPGGYGCYEANGRNVNGKILGEEHRLQGCTIYEIHQNGKVDIKQIYNRLVDHSKI